MEVVERRVGTGSYEDLKDKAFNFKADCELFMSLDNDFRSCIFYIWEDMDVGDMGRKVQCCRPLKSKLV